MTNRKSSTAANAEARNAKPIENPDPLYTAHRVHTIANLIYQQWIGNAAVHVPYGAVPHHTMVPGCPMPSHPAGGATFLAPPAVFYWYP